MWVPFASALAVSNAVVYNPIVKTENGDVSGTTLKSGVQKWTGIPFAELPVRFAPAKPAKPWNTTLNASQSKPSCMQQYAGSAEASKLLRKIFDEPPYPESEDCLYVNVWAPAKPAPPGGFPVFYWIYGGNLQIGHASLATYDGEDMAKNRDVVVVGANYRLNAFGFPGSPELAKGENNLGFLDQRLALSWVQKNIKAFGGDPKRVTIAGQSAGGFSVKQLVANPPSPLPFQAAIMQSQNAGPRDTVESWNKLSAGLGCNSTTASQLECVRSKTASEIQSVVVSQDLQFGPLADGVTHTTDVRPLIKNGTAAKIPIIMGSNSGEGTLFMSTGLAAPNSTLPTAFAAFVPGGPVVANFVLDELSPLYAKKNLTSDYDLGSAIFTDLGFTCGTSALSETFAEAGYSVNRYYYTAEFPASDPFPKAHAWHGSELEEIFGTFTKKMTDMARLSDVMQGSWTFFAKQPTGSLNNWPRYKVGSEQVKVFGNKKDSIMSPAEIDSPCRTILPFIEGVGL